MKLAYFFFIKIFIYLILITDITTAQYRLDTWTTDNGLPQNSITGLVQTPDNYIWATTNDGLVRFDGNSFRIFSKNNTPQISNNRLSSAFVDKSGRLWFQNEDGNIIYYENGAFSVVAESENLPAGVRSQFFHDETGGVILNVNRRPYRFQNGKFFPLNIESLPPDCPLLFSDSKGNMWFSGLETIYKVQNGFILRTYSIAQLFKERNYEVAYLDRFGNLWVGFFQTQGNKHLLFRIKNDDIQTIELPEQSVSHFAEDNLGNLWLSIYRKGIYRIAHESINADILPIKVLEPVLELEGISTNSSGHLCFDQENGLWVGTEKGLHRISPGIIRVFSRKDGLREENIYPIMSDQKGRIWAGAWANNLLRYENNAFKILPVSKETVFITSLFEDSVGQIWLGNIGNVYRLKNEKPVIFTEQAGFSESTEFSVIAETGNSALWFGTDRGLSRYLDGKSTVFTVDDGLPDNYVVALLPTRDGKLWIGTRNGLAFFENEKFTALRVEDGIASNYIRSLYEDREGVLWIGSYDSGLTRLKDGKFTVYKMADGLSSNGVFCILEDDAGWFWINSNKGIYRVNRHELNDFADGKTDSLNSILYNKKDGLLNVEGNGGRQPAGTKGLDGRLWFPTAEGIAVIDPKVVKPNRLPPHVLVEEIKIDGQIVSNEDYQSVIAQHSEITLSPEQNNLEISYTALSFINSEQLKFKYKLENLETVWTDAGTRRTAYYSYLPPGEYVFQVIAANRDGVWNEQGASFKIRVFPPYYSTWWFRSIAILSVAAIAAVLFYLRVRQLKIKAAQKEEFARQLIDSQEFERGRIAAELHDGLSQNLVIIKNRALFSLARERDQDYSREQLREIADASTEAIEEVREIIYDLRPIHLDRLGLTSAIEDIAERISEINNLELSKAIDNIDDLFPKSSENSIYRITQEILNNIVKHSGATKFELVIRRTSNEVTISIQDNGSGFSPEAVMSTRKKSGFGLLGLRERAELLGGRTIIESARGSGTKVSTILPNITGKSN